MDLLNFYPERTSEHAVSVDWPCRRRRTRAARDDVVCRCVLMMMMMPLMKMMMLMLMLTAGSMDTRSRCRRTASPRSRDHSYSSWNYGNSRSPRTKASLTSARQTVYAMARTLPASEGRTRDNVCGDAWRYGSDACHVVAKILNFSKVSQLVTTKSLVHMRDSGCHVFREQFVTYAWQMAQTVRHLSALTDFVPLKWHDLARHIAGIAWTKFMLVWGLP